MSVRGRALIVAAVILAGSIAAGWQVDRWVSRSIGRHLVDAGSVLAAPADARLTLDAGEVLVYATGPPPLEAVRVAGPDGSPIRVEPLDGAGLWAGSTNVILPPVARFAAPVAGSYTVAVAAAQGGLVAVVDSGPAGEYTSARGLGRVAGWAVAVVGGIVALIVAVVGLVDRSGGRRPPPGPPQQWPPQQWPPPGPGPRRG